MDARLDKNGIESIAPGEFFLILGFGVTGRALARFFASKGWHYLVAEDGAPVSSDDGHFRGQVRVENGALRCGRDPVAARRVKALLPSPGVPPRHPVAVWAAQNGIPVLSEPDLAEFYVKGELIGVTGTNGKSTTVKLTAALLNEAGLKAAPYGNIGMPLIEAAGGPPLSHYVIEESSYQLEQIHSLKHRYGVCLNVTDDHFDRYAGIGEYAAAKARLVDALAGDGVFIYNADDAHCARMAMKASRRLPFSLVNRFDRGGFLDGDAMVVRLNAGEFRFALKDCSLKGLHNAENMLASLLVALSVRSDPDSVEAYRRTLAGFRGLPHRVQKIRSEGGVDYYDDSKGTNVGAVVMSLAGFEKGVVLIAGGRDKGGDYAPLKGLVRGKVKKLILLGEARERMKEALGGETDTELVGTMREAVALAKKCARPGDVVLLSPACSSFDQYADYRARGLDFQKWVKELS